MPGDVVLSGIGSGVGSGGGGRGDEGTAALRPVVSRPYLRQDAADELRRYIRGAGLQPGASIPSERELCAKLGLSRTSVREALRFLEHEGLLEVRQGRPAVIRPPSLGPVLEPVVRRLAAERHLLRDLHAVRSPLEIVAARAAAGQRGERDLQAMRECLERMRTKLDRRQETIDEDVHFHDLLYQAAGNSVLLAFSRAVKDLLRAVREAATHVEAELERGWREHSQIFAAVMAGDPDVAGEVMQRHMDGVLLQQRQALHFLERVVDDETRRRPDGEAAGTHSA